ncbi:MAG: hypothetical protein LBK25_06425 [Treponema sp.]|nr:hypothetical protein [Treponema sp.]
MAPLTTRRNPACASIVVKIESMALLTTSRFRLFTSVTVKTGTAAHPFK